MTADTVLSLYHSGALICAAIVAVYLLLRWGTGHIPWIEEPQHAHYATAILTALGVLAVPAAAGHAPTLSMVLTAVGTLVALLLPGVAAATAPKQGQSGRASLTLVALLALAAIAACSLTMSCGASQKASLKNLATCTELAAVKDLTPTVESIIASGVSSWQAQLDALGKAFGIDELACAVTAAQQFFASRLGAGSDGDATAEQRASTWLAEHGYK
jgi:hypothetical protein